MTHYFTRDNDRLETEKKQFSCFVGNTKYLFYTDIGVFSKTGLDFGTRLLLETLIPIVENDVLDLGCGYGPIGIILADKKKCNVTMTDVNKRAIELARENSALNKVKPKIIASDGFEAIKSEFDYIITNPPIRAGKQTIYGWFLQAQSHLKSEGSLIFVMRKDQGALSAIKHCEGIYSRVETINKKSGYFVIKCRNGLTI